MAESAAPSLLDEIAELKQRIGVLEDVHAIKTLQFAYGYYLDKCLYDEVVDLYADDGECHFGGGIFRGKAGLRRLYCDIFRKTFTGGYNGPIYGFLLDHQQSQDIITVAPDRMTANGRFRCFMQAGTHVSRRIVEGPLQQWWEGGIYENTYVREGGIWKIKVLDYNLVFHAAYEKGWAHWERMDFSLRGGTYPANPLGPDEMKPHPRPSWPDTPVVPFHYAHPVTGRPFTSQPMPEEK